MVLDFEINQDVPIILGQTFIATERGIVDMELREIIFWVSNNEVSFQVCKTEKQPMKLKVVSVIDVEDMEVNDGSI